MSSLVPYTRPRGAIHDLGHLLSLSSDRCVLLCLSQQELYVLQNWMALDLEFESRYALVLQYNGYEPLTKDSELWGQWLSFVRGFQIGARDMTCNIEAGLNSIAASLQAMADKSCCGGAGAPLGDPLQNGLNCIGGIDPGLFEPGADQTITPGTPPAGFETWQDYQVYKCQAANYIWQIRMLQFQTLQGQGALATSIAAATTVLWPIAALAVAAPPIATLVVIVAGLVALTALTGGAFYWVSDVVNYWQAHRQEIVCAMYNSNTSGSAVAAIVNFTEDAIQGISFGALLAPLGGEISALFGEIASGLTDNNLVAPLFRNELAVMEAISDGYIDCNDCLGAGDCNDFRELLVGSGNLYGTGERTLTSEFVAGSGDHRIDALFQRGTCVKFVSTTAPGQLYRSWRCQGGAIVGPHWTGGDANNAWMCSGQFVGVSSVAFSIVMDIQADDCIDQDGNCP